MLIPTAVWPSMRPRWITSWDASRCYVLPDVVDCNIPRRGFLGAYGVVHDYSRGLLVELHRRLGGTPLSVHYRELLANHPHDAPWVPAHLPVGNEITARLRTGEDQLITVVDRVESHPHGPRGDYWQVTVNGEVPHDADDPALPGEHAYPPTLPFLAHLVDLHLTRVAARPLAPVIPLRPNSRP